MKASGLHQCSKCYANWPLCPGCRSLSARGEWQWPKPEWWCRSRNVSHQVTNHPKKCQMQKLFRYIVSQTASSWFIVILLSDSGTICWLSICIPFLGQNMHCIYQLYSFQSLLIWVLKTALQYLYYPAVYYTLCGLICICIHLYLFITMSVRTHMMTLCCSANVILNCILQEVFVSNRLILWKIYMNKNWRIVNWRINMLGKPKQGVLRKLVP